MEDGYDYDLLAIGSGPAGQKAAIQAAKLGRRAAIVERRTIGGVSVNRGTIPSKTLREAVIYLTGISQRAVYGDSYRLKEDITVEDLGLRTRQVVEREVDIVRNQLARNRVHVINGIARFVDPHTMAISGGEERRISAEKIVIATGTRPHRPTTVEFDNQTILDSDGLLLLERLPASIVVVGAGIIGIEYASMFAALGTKVTVVEKRHRLLDFVDSQIAEGLQYHLRDLGVVFRFGEAVTAVERHDGATMSLLESGKRIPAEVVLYAAGRQGETGDLDLKIAGLDANERGYIEVGPDFRTAVDHIYAAGDVIGWPSLAATSMEQGRLAAAHALDQPTHSMSELLPFGIYTIPEISYVGRNEEELTDAACPYEIGISRYRELARGQILGDSYGMLKLLVSLEDRTLLGVHVLGTNATELVHIGQAVMGNGGTVDYLVDAVFNYPTLAESYKVAALDAMNKLQAISTLAARA
ncbi:MAG TPA: Si-specific NAD(P)(+) transhydrogenase [Gaiellaceae bacterium]|nr:Si-specific NAD(P)(+) transhydrogenase [Gaiellaceae bacterium]